MNCKTCKHNGTMDYAELVCAPAFASGCLILDWCTKYDQEIGYINQFKDNFEDCYVPKED